ncbi:hypothetical protein FRC12_014697 [Ceratobasidium sp. 428]|nr:hypothetical protein FRC12_014697 [Ceratobasidium sp. 428]
MCPNTRLHWQTSGPGDHPSEALVYNVNNSPRPLNYSSAHPPSPSMDRGDWVPRSSLEGQPELILNELPPTSVPPTTRTPPVRFGPDPPPKPADSSRRPSVLPGLASLTPSVSVPPFRPSPSSKSADDRAKIPVPGLLSFAVAGLSLIGSVGVVGTPGPGGLLPSPSPNNASPGLDLSAVSSARPLSTGPNHNINPGSLPVGGPTPGLPTYTLLRSPVPAGTPVPLSPSNRPLNVKDALSNPEMVEVEFQNRPDIYDHPSDIMKDFKS